jgi:hypothetical protein
MVGISVWVQFGGLALRPLWQVLTRISGMDLRTIVADWAKEKVCHSGPRTAKSGAGGRPAQRALVRTTTPGSISPRSR